MDKFDQLFDFSNKKLSLYRFSLPLKKTINFKGHHLNTREGLWLIEHNPHGQDYIGEVSPLPGFSQETLAACQTQLINALQVRTSTNQDMCKQQTNHQQAHLTTPFLPSVSFALFCLQQRIPWALQTRNVAQDITLITIPLLQGSLNEIIKRYRELNYPATVKLKVARLSVAEDIKVIKSLIELNPTVQLRLDANQQWTAIQYIDFLKTIDCKCIDYIEEPTLSIEDNISISTQFKVSIALDESLLICHSLPTSNCIKALIIKPTLIGYPAHIQALLTHAQQQQLSLSISASFESPIALQQLAYLAKQWQQQTQLKVSLGLDTLHVFSSSISYAVKNDSDLQRFMTSQATCIWHS
ncbi:o-succinylbenzoate synthase [Psychromonas arctica]|uniref:o-succinylbenzoate synthase n=1 Tax=Psychromonas arctica TaxID=168275 RepID=UPI00040134D8|nr:o-succinylbenzoate synthase [Psychromonas arctica]